VLQSRSGLESPRGSAALAYIVCALDVAMQLLDVLSDGEIVRYFHAQHLFSILSVSSLSMYVFFCILFIVLLNMGTS